MGIFCQETAGINSFFNSEKNNLAAF